VSTTTATYVPLVEAQLLDALGDSSLSAPEWRARLWDLYGSDRDYVEVRSRLLLAGVVKMHGARMRGARFVRAGRVAVDTSISEADFEAVLECVPSGGFAMAAWRRAACEVTQGRVSGEVFAAHQWQLFDSLRVVWRPQQRKVYKVDSPQERELARADQARRARLRGAPPIG